MLLNCGVGEDSWESLGLQEDPAGPSQRRLVLSVHWKDWSWSLNSNTLANWCEELTHWKRPWCWEGLGAGGEGDDRKWDGWMAPWFNGHGFMRTLAVGDGQGGLVCCDSWGHKELDTTEWLNWTELNCYIYIYLSICLSMKVFFTYIYLFLLSYFSFLSMFLPSFPPLPFLFSLPSPLFLCVIFSSFLPHSLFFSRLNHWAPFAILPSWHSAHARFSRLSIS